jgi:hypothetical protein
MVSLLVLGAEPAVDGWHWDTMIDSCFVRGEIPVCGVGLQHVVASFRAHDSTIQIKASACYITTSVPQVSALRSGFGDPYPNP